MPHQRLARRPLVGLDVVDLDRVESAHSVLRRSTTDREDLAVEGSNHWEVATLPHRGEAAHLSVLLVLILENSGGACPPAHWARSGKARGGD